MTIKVGIAGIGFMGWIHWLAYQRVPGMEVVAIAETDPVRRTGDWRGIRGNFGPPGEQVDLTGVRVYSDVAELVQDKEIDVIDVCLPPAFHPAAALAAAAAGKHVFCEKPLALNVTAAESIVAACQQAGVLLAVGHVLPYFPEYRWAREQIQSGNYGDILGGTFKRVISTPEWIPDFFNLEKVGGPLIDLHVHDAHLIRLLFGVPKELSSRGRLRGETVEYAQTQYVFEDPRVVVGSTMGVVHQQGRPFTHGFEIHLERATLHFEFAAFADQGETMPVKLIDGDGNVLRPSQQAVDPLDGFAAEIREVQESIRSGRPSPILGGELACDAIRICAAQAESVLSGRPVRMAAASPKVEKSASR